MIVTVTETVDGVSVAGSGVSVTVYEGGPGPQGDTGPSGAAGPAGADGASAYEIAVANGFAGTEAEWLASLEGPQGPQGPAGADGAGVVASVEAPLVLTGDVLSLDDSGFEAAGAAAAAVAAHEAAANPHPTYLTQAEADALYSPAGSGGAVDSVNGQTGVVVLDADDIADGTVNHAFTAADDTKLAGIAAGATANATDAQLRDRSTHTGTQAAATISDLSEAIDDRVSSLIVAGTNVTTTYDDAAGTLTIDAAGGGGSVNDRLYVPGSAETTIDEFDDDSLDAAWARVDPVSSSHFTWTEAGNVLSLYQAGGCTSTHVHALLRPIGTSMAAGDAFVTCYTMLAAPAVDYVVAGLILTNGTTVGAGAQVACFNYSSAAGRGMREMRAFTNFTTYTGSAINAGYADGLDFPKKIYVRLVMTAANTWRQDVSPDGVSWLIGIATYSSTLTPTHVGFWGSSYTSTAKGVTSFEFLRRVSGVS